MIPNHQIILIGGYSKSGTTYIQRIFDNFETVYAYGELDYFRLCFNAFQKTAQELNKNINVVNKQVYDDSGTIKPMTNRMAREWHKKNFLHFLLGNERTIEPDAFLVEKTPHNLMHIHSARYVFPESPFLTIYREPKAVYTSLLRHLIDYRTKDLADPEHICRVNLVDDFLKRWSLTTAVIDENRKEMSLIRYEAVRKNLEGFIDYLRQDMFKKDLPLKAPLHTLSKEHYIQSLPEEKRKTSLVQPDTTKIPLSDYETEQILKHCHAPQSAIFDF